MTELARLTAANSRLRSRIRSLAAENDGLHDAVNDITERLSALEVKVKKAETALFKINTRGVDE